MDRTTASVFVAVAVLWGIPYHLLIARAGATRAALTIHLAPVVCVVVGAVALSDTIAPTAILGLALILAG